MSSVLLLIGRSIGSAATGIYMQTHQANAYQERLADSHDPYLGDPNLGRVYSSGPTKILSMWE
jgi:hypothetical protein